MLLLATQAEPQMIEHASPQLGRLVQPRHYPKIEATAARGVPWAADNDAFNGWGDGQIARFDAMCDRLKGLPGCLFVTVPDVVADAHATAVQFERWSSAPRRRALPAALVAQDGIEHLQAWLTMAWPRIGALFIGGSTEFKLGPIARELVAQAHARGKWVHMGRVNTARRIAYAREIGCDSIDGTKWVRWRDTYLQDGIARVAAPPQLSMNL